MIDELITASVMTARDCVRSRFKRIAMVAAFALTAIIIGLALGALSWGHVLIILCVAAIFWMVLTIVDKTLNLFVRSRES
jgi:hypothetical protein